MKTFNLILLIACSALLFYGCGASKSFKQKHYNNRYYVGITKKEAVEDKEEQGVKDNFESEKEEIVDLESPIANYNNKQGVDSKGQIISIIDESVITDPIISIEQTSTFYSSANILGLVLQQDSRNFKSNHIYSFIKNKKGRQKTVIKPASGDRDSLSLLWIVILVILILWAIGWGFGGFGLGGLIHVLALIALILLILWLLRII